MRPRLHPASRLIADEPGPVTGAWVECEDVPEPEPVTLVVHPIQLGTTPRLLIPRSVGNMIRAMAQPEQKQRAYWKFWWGLVGVLLLLWLVYAYSTQLMG